MVRTHSACNAICISWVCSGLVICHCRICVENAWYKVHDWELGSRRNNTAFTGYIIQPFYERSFGCNKFGKINTRSVFGKKEKSFSQSFRDQFRSNERIRTEDKERESDSWSFVNNRRGTTSVSISIRNHGRDVEMPRNKKRITYFAT